MTTARQVINSTKPRSFKDQGVPGGYQTPLGAIGYDNVRDDIEKAKKVRELSIGAYMMPKVDGAANEVMVTDGAGTVSWAASAAHASSHEIGGADLVDHDNLTNFVANEHIDHTAVSISAGGILSGGGTIAANRTISLAQADVDHDQISNVSIDDHHAKSHAHNGADGSGTVAHSDTTGQGVDDHHNSIHAGSHAQGMADPVDHDTLLNFVANEHIDWTNTFQTLVTTGDGTFDTLTLTGGDITIPNGVDNRILLGDALGANRFRIMDSTLTSVYTCDSNGNITTYGSTTFNVSGGSINQVGVGLVVYGGGAANDFITFQPSTVDADSITFTGGAGMIYTTPVTITNAQSWFNNSLTTGVCHDTVAGAGTSGSGYKITLDSDNANDFRAIHVVSGAGSNITVHRVDELGLIQNWDEVGASRWKRRTWKGCNEMDNTLGVAMTTVSWPNASHYKLLTATPSGNNSIYWSVQIPWDWDGVTDLLCAIRLINPAPLVIGQTLSWNVAMNCEQAGDVAAVNAQATNGFYVPGPTAANTIHEITWVLNYNSIPGPLQPGDHVSFHFYCIGLGGEDEWEDVGVIGAWCDYKSTQPELSTLDT